MACDRTGRVHRKKNDGNEKRRDGTLVEKQLCHELTQASLRKEAAVLRSKQIIDLKGWSRTANFQSELLSRNVFQKLV